MRRHILLAFPKNRFFVSRLPQGYLRPFFQGSQFSSRRNIASEPSALKPRTFPTTGFDVIDASADIEEELIPNFKINNLYPVHIGELFNNRYQG